MVRALLSYGISPNEQLGTETAWQCALLQCYRCSRIDLGALGQILKSMIMYGADPNVAIPISESVGSIEHAPTRVAMVTRKFTVPTPGLRHLGLELERLLATKGAKEPEENEPKSVPVLEMNHGHISDATSVVSPSILPNWMLEISAAILFLVLEVVLLVLAIPKPHDLVEYRHKNHGQAEAQTEVAQQSNEGIGTFLAQDLSSISWPAKCCTQRVFRYIGCQCLYRRDRVKNRCQLYQTPGHNVQETVFLIELTCPQHAQAKGPYVARNI